MTSAYARSASEPRQGRAYARERGNSGGTFWNPTAPRDLDADSWRRAPTAENPVTRGAPTSRGASREERDRSRGRIERPPSRGSGGEYRHSSYSSGGSRYPNSYRGRGRGRSGGGPRMTEGQMAGDMNGRGVMSYRHPYPRYELLSHHVLV